MPTNNQKLILEQLLQSHHVVVTTHINPDGDALGASLGLVHWLHSQGVQASVLLPNSPSANLMWMPGAESARVWNPSDRGLLESADTIVVLDLNSIARLGDLGTAVAETDAVVINIDHHTKPEDFASLAWIDTDACSTCFMIAMLLVGHFGPAALPGEAAQCLYAGIMTDTGSFRFPRTTADVFHMAGELVGRGADPVKAYDQVMNQGSIGRTMLLGKTLSTMQVLAGGRLCVMSVSKADMVEFECSREDIDGFVQQTLTLKGVEMGIVVVELDAEVKISFRSKGTTYVHELAARYGGGGHQYAAGARVSGKTLREVCQDISSVASASLEPS